MNPFISYADLAWKLVKAAIGLPQNSQTYAQYGDMLIDMGRPPGLDDVLVALVLGDDGAGTQFFFSLLAVVSPDGAWLFVVSAFAVVNNPNPVEIAQFKVPGSKLSADLTHEEIAKNYSLT